MHVLLVTYEFPPEMEIGGIGSYMNHLAYLLNSRGHLISVISATTAKDEQIVDRGFCTNYLVPASDSESFRLMALSLFERNFKPGEVDLIESPEVGACALEIKLKYPTIPLLVKMHTPGVLITKVSNTYLPLFRKLRYVAGALIRGRIDLGYWNRQDLKRHLNPEYIICTLANLILSPSAALKHWATTYWKLPQNKIQLLANPFTADDQLFLFPVQRTTKTISSPPSVIRSS